MHWTIDCIAVFFVSVVLTGIIIPQILLIAFRNKLFDKPDERKIHTAAVPRLGGLAFMPAILFSLSFVIGCDILASSIFPASTLFVANSIGVDSSMLSGMLFSLCSLLMLYLVGMTDDMIGLKYRAKLVAQLLAAILLAAGGVRVDNLHGMLGIYQLSWPVAWLFSTVTIMFIINAISLIDGLDGLASGLSATAMIFYGFVFVSAERWIDAMLAFAGVGTLIQFFYYNVFGNANTGKKIFMGHTGSLTTGIILAILSVEITHIRDLSGSGLNTMTAAFAPLALPCLDMIRVFFHRLIRGRNPLTPDKAHIHHKLLAIGLPKRPAMILIVATSAVIVALNLWLASYTGAFTVLVVDLTIWIAVNWWLTRTITVRQHRFGIKSEYQ